MLDVMCAAELLLGKGTAGSSGSTEDSTWQATSAMAAGAYMAVLVQQQGRLQEACNLLLAAVNSSTATSSTASVADGGGMGRQQRKSLNTSGQQDQGPPQPEQRQAAGLQGPLALLDQQQLLQVAQQLLQLCAAAKEPQPGDVDASMQHVLAAVNQLQQELAAARALAHAAHDRKPGDGATLESGVQGQQLAATGGAAAGRRTRRRSRNTSNSNYVSGKAIDGL